MQALIRGQLARHSDIGVEVNKTHLVISGYFSIGSCIDRSLVVHTFWPEKKPARVFFYSQFFVEMNMPI